MPKPDLFGYNEQHIGSATNLETVSQFTVDPQEIGNVDNDQEPRRSIRGATLFIVGTTILLGVQTFRLQVLQGERNRVLAQGNSVRIVTVPADRGLIEDSSGTVLAHNSRKAALAINPRTLPTKLSARQAVYRQLQQQAGVDTITTNFIEAHYYDSGDPFAIKTGLTQDEILLAKEHFATTPGVVIQELPIRQYVEGPSLGQLLGYVGAANTEADSKAGFTPNQQIGKTGLEDTYNQLLLGTPGKQQAEVNATGETVHTLPDTADSVAKAGQTLRLSLDLNLQKITATALQHAVERRAKTFGPTKVRGFGATAVLMDPNDGSVKAMVSLPDYPDNLFGGGISQTAYKQLLQDPANPLLNRAIQGAYPSGSTIKPLIAAAALQAGIIDPNRTVVTPEAITVGGFRFPDWKYHGETNLRKAIAESNDIYFYALGGGWADGHIAGLGIDGLNTSLSAFGLGKKTGIDIPSEVNGLIPGPDWKRGQIGEGWYIGDTYHQSIGQGYMLATPLQMAAAAAAIANGGTLWKPHLGQSLIDPVTGQSTPLPVQALNSHWVSPANVQVVREGMLMTTQSGSARPLGKLHVVTAGKTGTAEFGNQGLTHAWYTGFAPYDHPTLAFAILVEAGGESFDSSEPVAEEILRGAFNEPLLPGQQLNSEPSITPNAEYRGEH